QELIQELYVKLLTSHTLAAYNPEYPFRNWFWRVVYNFWVSDLRKRLRSAAVALPETEPTGEAGPLEEALAQELQQRLDEAITTLSQEEREVVVRASDDQPVSQIARELGMSVSRVYRVHFRARRAIERRLGLVATIKSTEEA